MKIHFPKNGMLGPMSKRHSVDTAEMSDPQYLFP